MEKTSLTLLVEPRGDLYRKLIDYAVKECKIALIVVRKTITISVRGNRVLEQLEPYLESKIESMEWPGTKLLDETALVFRYYLVPECAEILKQTTDSLYNWIQPDLPEDLCLLKDNDDIWFTSIAHEKDSYFSLSQEEKKRLIDALPELITMCQEDVSALEI